MQNPLAASPTVQDLRLGRSLSIDQAAAMLGMSRRTVYYRIREGRLQTIRTLGGSQRVLGESVLQMLRPHPVPSSLSRSLGNSQLRNA